MKKAKAAIGAILAVVSLALSGCTDSTQPVEQPAHTEPQTEITQSNQIFDFEHEIGGSCFLALREGSMRFSYDPEASEVLISPYREANQWSLSYYPCAGSATEDHSDCTFDFHRLCAVLFIDENDGLLVDENGSAAGSTYISLLRTYDGGRKWSVVGQQRVSSSFRGFCRTDADTLLAVCDGGAMDPHVEKISLVDGTTEIYLLDEASVPQLPDLFVFDYYVAISGINDYGYDVLLRARYGNPDTESREIYCQYRAKVNSQFEFLSVDSASVQEISYEEYLVAH